MSAFEWDPATYEDLMAEDVPDYPRLQSEVVQAAAAAEFVQRILDLGIGSGLTAQKVLAQFPGAALVGVDSSAAMLAAAADLLPERTQLHRMDLHDELPAGPFDLVTSMLAVHHLDGAAKRNLFARVASVLEPGGLFVLADLVVPDDPADVVTYIDWDYDLPSRLDEQLAWLTETGFLAHVAWQYRDLAVIQATSPSSGARRR